MNTPAVAIIVLAAGHGTRMKSKLPKVLHKIGGLAMLGHVLDSACALSPEKKAIVIGNHAPETGDYARNFESDIEVFVQAPPQGTGDAVKQAMPAIENFSGAALILYADTPLIKTETMQALCGEISNGAAVAVLGFRPRDPGAYGRLKTGADGALAAIIEAKDATEDELAISLCNSGVMAIEAEFLREKINEIGNDNAKNEYYLTDIVAIANNANKRCSFLECDVEEVIGVNSREELAVAEKIFQNRMRRRAMINGATLRDPATVYFSYDTEVGSDVIIGQNVVFEPGVSVDDGAEIKAFSHFEGAMVSEGVSVGPFARLRPGANLGVNAKVGNFVEIKKATIGAGAKVSHLTYIGDADIGAETNIGAGTITCNYDGYGKHRTIIGAKAFIGSNSSLVAPITIGDGAYVGSGSVITKDVEPGDLAVARGRQAAIKGWAARFRKTHGSSD